MKQPVPTSDQLALVLRSRRSSLGLTQQAVADRVGLLVKTVRSLESAPERCRVDSLFKLLSALELEVVVRPKPELRPADNW